MPRAISARLTPTLRNHDGGLLSNLQFSTFPPSPLASILTTMWGLIQSTFVSVPATVNRLVMSNSADGEWWAHNDPAANTRAMPIANTVKARLNVRFKALSLPIVRKYITPETGQRGGTIARAASVTGASVRGKRRRSSMRNE